MSLALVKSLAALAYLGLVIFGVVRACSVGAGSRVRLDSVHSIPDSVALLAARCMPANARSLVSHWMTGEVRPGGVRLMRRVKGQRNSFSPVFTGYCRTQGGKVVLVGEFGMPIGSQGFLVLWCGAVGAVILACLHGALLQAQPRAWTGVGIGVALMAACIAILRIGKASSAGDVAWMTAVMREALA